MGFYLLVCLVTMEDICAFQPADVVIPNNMALIKLKVSQMVSHLINKVFAFLVFVQGLYNVGQCLYFFVFGKFRIKVVCFKGLFKQRKHDKIGDEKIKVSFSGFRQHIQIFVQSKIINNSFHSLKVTEIILCCQIEGI